MVGDIDERGREAPGRIIIWLLLWRIRVEGRAKSVHLII